MVLTRLWYTGKQQNCQYIDHQKYQNVINKVQHFVIFSWQKRISANFDAEFSYIIDKF